MTNMKDVNAEKSLVECEPRDNKNFDNIDPVPKQCGDDNWPSQKRVPRNPPLDWRQVPKIPNTKLGQTGNCDPIQTGQIINDLDTPNREVVYRYARGIRANDEAMLDTFRNIKVIDDQGQQHTVPIIWASQEKAVDMILQDNVRKDNSLVVDRIRLPIMAIWNNGMTPDLKRFTYQKAYSILPWLSADGHSPGFTQQEKYQKDTFFGVTRGWPVDINYVLYVWTLYEEDMNQILEQCFLKFSSVAYLQVKGVYWEVIVTLDSTANNIDLEPGDAKVRVLKYQLNMTAKSYIPQPIYRLKHLPPTICEDPTATPDSLVFPRTPMAPDPENPGMPEGVPMNTMETMTDEEMRKAIEEVRSNLAELEKSLIQK